MLKLGRFLCKCETKDRNVVPLEIVAFVIEEKNYWNHLDNVLMN